LFRQYEHHLMNFLMLLPVCLLVIGLIGSVWVVIKKKSKQSNQP
ncbi:DedA family protein, partial [Proteus mirabilis]